MKNHRKTIAKSNKYSTLEEKLRHCTFSRFCETFGEYKCLKFEHRIINAEVDCLGCKYHRRVSHPKEKSTCQCSTCAKHQSESVEDC